MLEEGRYEIVELTRLPEDESEVELLSAEGQRVPIRRGRVVCRAFPIVVITNNGEREFPPPFLRRCLRLNIQPPDADKLATIVASHLGQAALAKGEWLIEQFVESRDHGDLATDQLLNAIYLVTSGLGPTTRERMVAQLFSPLDHLVR